MSEVIHTGSANVCTVCGMGVAWAIVTSGDGVELVDVAEVDGVLVEARTGVPIDLVSLVMVDGLPDLDRVGA